jgi:hypothetical protein
LKSFKTKLMTSTVIPALVGTGVAMGGWMISICQPRAASSNKTQINKSSSNKLPTAKPRLNTIQLAACNPCRAKKCGGCNPCAAKKRCGGCNPCAAKKRCGGCNPCAAKKRGCGGCNPCNPCGGAPVIKLTAAEANKAYNCLLPEMTAGYAKASAKAIKGFQRWSKVNNQPYVSGTHGNRFVNNYANKKAAIKYSQYEKLGKMPVGSVLAKDSFAAAPNGKTGPGPMFVMEKMKPSFNKASGNWRYTLIMPNGGVIGVTNGKNSKAVKFCYQCHMAVAGTQDSLMLLPQEFRVKF